jgi:glycolate oxidase FAD binding subunit
VLASNASGPKRLLYGTARDLLIGITVVHADGGISKAGGKVTKNVTGYDMMKLYIGSLGTLAVIAEATLKLRPVPSNQELTWSIFDSREAAVETAQGLMTPGLLPNAVELVNPPVTTWLRQGSMARKGVKGGRLSSASMVPNRLLFGNVARSIPSARRAEPARAGQAQTMGACGRHCRVGSVSKARPEWGTWCFESVPSAHTLERSSTVSLSWGYA